MKGDELLARIHTISPETVKIMLTGQANIDAVSRAVRYANLYRYISKPWQIDDLKLTEERSIELLYAMITKVSASILIMNQLEKYENSAVLNRKLEDLYVLIHCSVQEEYISPIKLKEEYKNIMTEVFKSVGNTKYFNDNV